MVVIGPRAVMDPACCISIRILDVPLTIRVESVASIARFDAN
jgi:hypothetical protein